METEKVVVVSIVAGAVLIIGGFFALTAYNNTQNVQRDKYLAQHCKSVSGNMTVNGSVAYACGASK